MKILLTPTLIFLSFFVNGQTTSKKISSDEQNEIIKGTISKEKALSETANNTCKCIDSISIDNKNAKENSFEVKKCIDKQVVGYQSTLKIMETLNGKKDKKENVQIFTNPESSEYKKYYYDIERALMTNCEAIKNVIGMNNKESEKSVSTNPAAINAYNKGNDYFRREDYKKALPFFENAVKMDPEFVFAWDNIGVCNRRLGNLDQALNAYEMSLKADPKNATALQNLPLVYIDKKEYQKAIQSYENIAKINKDNPEIYFGIGAIYLQYIIDNEKALDNMCKAYNLYIAQNSPYRSDVENIIQNLYGSFKEKGEIEKFNEILKSNNIKQN